LIAVRPRPHRRAHLAVASVAACLCITPAFATEDNSHAGRGKPAAREEPERIGPADFAILIAMHVTAAEMNCPYRIEEGRLRRLLHHHGLALGDAYTASRSRQLKPEVDKVMEGFRTDRQKACDTAWKHFGPGATFEGFLQPR
jgi:hypothetical protein